MSPEKEGISVKLDFKRLMAVFPDVQTLVLKVAEATINIVRGLVIERTPVGDPKTDWHYGQLKASWSTIQKTEGGFSFSTGIPYAVILEKGLYKNVGPRTVAAADGIFSSQAPGGIVTPIVTDPKLMAYIVNSIVSKLVARAGKTSA